MKSFPVFFFLLLSSLSLLKCTITESDNSIQSKELNEQVNRQLKLNEMHVSGDYHILNEPGTLSKPNTYECCETDEELKNYKIQMSSLNEPKKSNFKTIYMSVFLLICFILITIFAYLFVKRRDNRIHNYDLI